ncbi:MAG: 30S ribosomal protein S6 [Treponema sp.]|nr:MAG: 30S ribosomal protein S6 [Treponema sp.]
MRKYELMTVFTVDEESYNAGIESLRKTLDGFGVKVVSEDSRGDRNLTYEIKKQSKGRYVLFIIESETDKISELTRQLKLIPAILTFMFVRIES